VEPQVSWCPCCCVWRWNGSDIASNTENLGSHTQRQHRKFQLVWANSRSTPVHSATQKQTTLFHTVARSMSRIYNSNLLNLRHCQEFIIQSCGIDYCQGFIIQAWGICRTIKNS
jgi:hypothetical protein